MGFKFGNKSLEVLGTVDPRLQAVAKRALEISEVDFSIAQGFRTLDEQMRLYGKGRTAAECHRAGVPESYARPNEAEVTWTIHGSNHLKNNALDVAPFINGKLQYDDNGKLGLWPKIATAFKAAAAELRTPIRWGGDGLGVGSKKKIDRPHFELL
jgi:peptidoglycan L-alanyl-D-glutamate endopeptidase CwlK